MPGRGGGAGVSANGAIGKEIKMRTVGPVRIEQ